VMSILSTNRKNINVWGIPSMETYLTSIMIRKKYDDWSFRFHHFLENGRFYRENTCKCSPLVTKWQIILHFHCCFNNKYTFILITEW
jgi:hypothetical protein